MCLMERNWHQHFSHQSGQLAGSFEIRFIPSRQHFSITRSPHCLVTYFWMLDIVFFLLSLVSDQMEEIGSQVDQPSDIFSCLKWKKTADTLPLWDIRVMKFNPGHWKEYFFFFRKQVSSLESRSWIDIDVGHSIKIMDFWWKWQPSRQSREQIMIITMTR